ncbi:MCM DNA helicase complex subunit [Homalodisca vitripennis]|nr:MCM DNA helicase complex subunit [Homalodisca vitripennis]
MFFDRNPGEQDGEVLPMGSTVDLLSTQGTDVSSEEMVTPIWEKYDPLLHGNSRSKSDQILSMKFMRKYIHIAKVLKPVLTEEASEAISEEYSRLRSQDFIESDVARTQPVTVRTLETLIRLSTAHAKARLSRLVELEDAQAAIQLVQFAYFKKVLEKEKKKRRRGTDDSDAEESEEEEGDNASQQSKRSRRDLSGVTQPTIQTGEEVQDPFDYDSSSESPAKKRKSPRKKKPAAELTDEQLLARDAGPSTSDVQPLAAATSISSERFQKFKSSVVEVFRGERAQSLSLERVVEFANGLNSDAPFSDGEVAAAIERMSEANQIMVADGIVFLI